MTDTPSPNEPPSTAKYALSLEELQRLRDVLAKEAAKGRPGAAEIVADYDRRIAKLKRKQGIAE
jgi:hypothetical protein